MKYDEANKDRQIPEEATVLGMKQQDKELGLVEDEASRDKAQLVDEQVSGQEEIFQIFFVFDCPSPFI